MKDRILVTGGAGFIGSHLAERLLQRGRTISIVDDLNDFYDPALKKENLHLIRQHGDFSFHHVDIRDLAALESVFRVDRPTAIVHLAARAGVPPSVQNPLLYEETNVRGTANLLELARQFECAKVIFGSSSSVYGVRNQVPFREDEPCHSPASPYAATKLAGELLCHTYAHLYGMQILCLRFFTVYGPRQRPDLVIHKFTRLLFHGDAIPLCGDGSSARDYTWIDDIIDGIEASLSLSLSYEIINLGSSNPIVLRDLVSLLEKTTGMAAKRRYVPPRPGDVPLTFADISKANALLGYSPKVSIGEGLARFVGWYRKGCS